MLPALPGDKALYLNDFISTPRTKHRGPKMQSPTAHARRKRKKALENKARAQQRRK